MSGIPGTSSAGSVNLHSTLSAQQKQQNSPNEQTNVARKALQQFIKEIKPASSSPKGHFLSFIKQPPNKTPNLSLHTRNSAIKGYPPTEQQAKIQLGISAELANYPYSRSLDAIAYASNKLDPKKSTPIPSWHLAKPLALQAGKGANLSTSGSEAFIYNKKSGLTAYVFQNNKTKPPEIRIIFGGTSTGKHVGGLITRTIRNSGSSLKQWVANGINALRGRVPRSYKDAKKLTETVQKIMQNDSMYKNFKLSVSGHSKGGGEASFAAISLKEPVEAICFSSAELGKDMHNILSDKQKRNAHTHVTHYKIKGDIIPNIGKALTVGHIGKVVTIPHDNTPLSSPIDKHAQFARHIHYFIDTK
ncbi:MAG: hypothetical protein QS721_03585 [Candidatus Endonucleobacter sp. (ex Gigantidas childressi)]|nr:hypothetical protein [Candidatus Endonucleobacter sp. (ex Gigantidas childressi)]